MKDKRLWSYNCKCKQSFNATCLEKQASSASYSLIFLIHPFDLKGPSEEPLLSLFVAHVAAVHWHCLTDTSVRMNYDNFGYILMKGTAAVLVWELLFLHHRHTYWDHLQQLPSITVPTPRFLCGHHFSLPQALRARCESVYSKHSVFSLSPLFCVRHPHQSRLN